jgi:hypothetical protein
VAEAVAAEARVVEAGVGADGAKQRVMRRNT